MAASSREEKDNANMVFRQSGKMIQALFLCVKTKRMTGKIKAILTNVMVHYYIQKVIVTADPGFVLFGKQVQTCPYNSKLFF